MKEILYREWNRYEHAEFMKRPAVPLIQAQATLDVTRLRHYAKERDISFYLGMIWLTTKVIERREDFRWRLRGEKVVLIDSPIPSFTDRMAGTELYKIVHAGRVGEDMVTYAGHARAVADAQTFYFPPDSEEARDDFTYFSCIPQVSFTSLLQPLDGNKDNFIPSIGWSRFWAEGERTMLPYTVQCNHRQVDGLQVAQLFLDLQEALDALA